MSEGPRLVYGVVLVDDQPIIRVMLRSLFSAAGDFNIVAEAADAREALEVVAATTPDIVLLDNDLGPSRRGVDIVADLRAAAPGVRIVMFSASVPIDFAAAGVDAAVAKPNLGLLIGTCRVLLAGGVDLREPDRGAEDVVDVDADVPRRRE